ncbi:dihydrodipicolinate reductase C-terminal domain-containing protein [Paenibacillus typhae]|uniref:dihydrodipicolinate reductase C-terminal domain-containing protein n=1 Tax=Paenibacillus typhae TaxID=1174501 RepID=UPI0039EE13B2
MSSIREGDIIGEHYVTLYNVLGETTELSHQLESRRDLTNGILMAAKFIAAQPNGLYTIEDLMTDVLSTGK